MRGGWLASARRMGRKNLGRLAGAVLFGGILGPITLLLGLRLASAGSVSLWLNLELVATVLLGHFLFREPLGPRGWVAAAGVITASALLTAGESAGGLAAGALVALACLLWGLDNHLTALIDAITPAQSTFWKGLAAGVFNLALAAILGSARPELHVALSAIAVGAVSYGASIALYITAAQQLGATRAQMVFAGAPFFGAGLSALALSEPPAIVHFVAAGLLAVSLSLLFRDHHDHVHTHEAVEHEHRHRHDDGHHLHEHSALPAIRWHSHRHRHQEQTHRHAHWSDLHHRHSHSADKS